jgi:hypothetical protein
LEYGSLVLYYFFGAKNSTWFATSFEELSFYD